MADDIQSERFGESVANESRSSNVLEALPVGNESPYAPTGSHESGKKGCGCWAWGCGGLLVGCLLLIAGVGLGGYWLFNSQVEKYTDTEPTEMPIVEIEEEEMARLQERVESFSRRFNPEAADEAAEDEPQAPAEPDAGDQPLTLVLTADEINALIQADETLKGKVHVIIEDGTVEAQISIPTDEFPGMKGRYLNADVELEVSLEDDILVVKLKDANVKGDPLPEAFMKGLSQENLAKEANNNPELAKSLEPFESIEVIEDKIHLRLKPIEEPEEEAQQPEEVIQQQEVLPAEEPATTEEAGAEAPLPFEVPAAQEPALTP